MFYTERLYKYFQTINKILNADDDYLSDEDDDENWNKKETNKTTDGNKEKIKNLTYTYNHTEQCVNIADTEGYLSLLKFYLFKM